MRILFLLTLSICPPFLLATKLTAQQTRPTPEEVPVVQELKKLGAEVFWYKGFPHLRTKQRLGWGVNISRNEDPLPVLKLLEKFSPEEFRSLNFTDSPITDEMLANLPRYKNLYSLTLNRNQCTNVLLPKIAELTHLVSLNLSGNFSDAGLEHLKVLTELESLTIHGSDFTDAGMKSISQIQSLQSLSIHKCSITDEGMKSIGQLKNLYHLTIYEGSITAAGFAHLSGLENLGSLSLLDTPCTDAGVANLTNMEKLRSINFNGKEFTDQTIEHLLKLPLLSTIRITESQITPAGIKKLEAQFPKANIYIVGPGSPKQPPRKFPPGFKPPQRIVGTPATVEVPHATVKTASDDEFNWDGNHALTSGGTVYLPDKEAGAQLKFTVNKGGYVVLAVSWMEEGKLSSEQQKQRKSLGQLLREGWKIAGYRDRRRADGTLDRHFLLARNFKPGTEYEILTRHKTAPILFLPTRTAIQFLGRYQNTTASIEDLEKLPPRDPQAGLANFDTLLVTAQHDPTPALPLGNGQLLAEIARQAIQLTARHEFSLGTIDTSSALTLPHAANPVNRPLEVVSSTLPESVEITVLRAKDQKLQVQWKHWYTIEGDERYERLTSQLEKESRTSLIEELRTIGFSGEPYQLLDSAEVSPAALKHLTQLNCIAQFTAIQYLHEQLQTDGESPERLSALARAYANLGLLTEYHFRPAKNVWRARAVLYAERLQALWPDSPLGIPTKAYAWALVGRQQTALKLLADDSLKPKSLPPWGRLIHAFCHFNQAQIEEFTEDPQLDGLSKVLLLVGTLGYRDDSYVLDAAVRAVRETQDCYLATNELSRFSGGSIKQLAMHHISQTYGKHLADRLRQVPELPPQAIEQLDQAQQEWKRLDELPEETDFLATQQALRLIGNLRNTLENSEKPQFASGTPSHEVLLAMLDDLMFVHIWRRLIIQRFSFSLKVDDEFQGYWPDIQNYPLAAVLACLATDLRTVEQGRQLALQKFHPADASDRWVEFSYHLNFLKDKQFSQLLSSYRRNGDKIFEEARSHGQVDAVRPRDNYLPYFVENLQLVAPHMPATIAWIIETDPALTLEQGKEFALKYKNSPPVLYALADRFTFEKKYDLAEQCWKRYVSLAPVSKSWQKMAEMYLQKGEEDLWLDHMEKGLQAPAYGLEHSSINRYIADHFVAKRDFRRALPYATLAAESYSDWGLRCAAICYEGLQNWTEAEDYFETEAESYDGPGVNWYFFCRRTGQGKLNEAYQRAFEYVGRAERGESEAYPTILGAVYFLEKQYEKALAAYERNVKDEPSPLNWLLVANAADMLGDAELYRSAITQAIRVGPRYALKEPKAPQQEFVAVAKVLLKALDTPSSEKMPAGIDQKELATLLSSFDDSHRLVANYFFGNFYLQRDKEELAIAHLLKCMEMPFFLYHYRTFAGAQLLELAITPEDYREALQTPIEAAKPVEDAAVEESAEETVPASP